MRFLFLLLFLTFPLTVKSDTFFEDAGALGVMAGVAKACGENPQKLDDYEAEEEFTLEYVFPEHAIERNCNGDHKEKVESQTFGGMLERENRVLELVINEILYRKGE
jgi:hypothetical protein